jgi:hypothetical protein
LKLFLITIAALFGLALAGCGGGDKKTESEPTSRPAATVESVDDGDDADEGDADSDDGDSEDGDNDSASSSTGAVGDLFNSVFSNGFSGGGSAAGMGGGDESMLGLLPDSSDFPSDYTPLGEFTFSAPAGSSELGAADMAMTMAMKGDMAALGAATDPSEMDFSSIEMMMAMVMRPEDLQELGDAFAEIENLDEEDIQREIDRGFGEMEGFTVENFEVLDGSGLGDGGFGMEMTIDMSAFGELFGAFAGGSENAPELDAMTMRMYIFGQGDYVGAVMRFAFSDTLGEGTAELDLAEIIEQKLADAPST